MNVYISGAPLSGDGNVILELVRPSLSDTTQGLEISLEYKSELDYLQQVNLEIHGTYFEFSF